MRIRRARFPRPQLFGQYFFPITMATRDPFSDAVAMQFMCYVLSTAIELIVGDDFILTYEGDVFSIGVELVQKAII